MKKNTKIILAIFALLISNILSAQSISVESFRCSKKEDLAKKSNIRNFGNQVCALIIVETHEESLEFICRDIEKQEQKQGEIWLFVSPGIERITINDRSFGPMINYTFPKKIESGKTYRMKLKTDLPQRFNKPIAEENQAEQALKEREKAIKEKEDAIRKREQEIREKERLIKEREKAIKKQEVEIKKTEPLYKNIKTIKIFDGSMEAFSFNKERTKLIYKDCEESTIGPLTLFDITNGKKDSLLEVFILNDCVFTPDETKVVYSDLDYGTGTIDLSNKEMKIIQERPPFKLQYSKDGTKLLLGYGIGRPWFDIMDANTFKVIKTIEREDLEPKIISLNPDADRVVVVSNQKDLVILDWANEKCLQTLKGHTDTIRSVSYSPDGRKIISTSQDKTIKIWDANTGECLKNFTKHIDIPYFAEFSPDGTKILSVSCDGAIKIWEANTGRVIQTIQEKAEIEEGRYVGHMLVRFTLDGKRIVGVTIDNFLKIWELE